MLVKIKTTVCLWKINATSTIMEKNNFFEEKSFWKRQNPSSVSTDPILNVYIPSILNFWKLDVWKSSDILENIE